MIVQNNQAGRQSSRAPPQKKDTDMNKPTISTITVASFNADEAATYLPLAAQATIKGKADIDTAKGKQASAFAIMVAGFSTDDIATRPWAFDIKGNDDSAHTYVECTGFAEFGNDDLAWKRNSEGKVSKVAQSAYKAALQNAFFNMPESNAAVWTAISRVVPMARAIREEGMTASVVDGALVLGGGNGKRADAMRAAKTVAALKKAVEGETGTNREKPQNEKSTDSAAPVATPSEILAAALRLIEGAAKGEEALAPTALSFARRIASLVASQPDTFADD